MSNRELCLILVIHNLDEGPRHIDFSPSPLMAPYSTNLAVYSDSSSYFSPPAGPACHSPLLHFPDHPLKLLLQPIILNQTL